MFWHHVFGTVSGLRWSLEAGSTIEQHIGTGFARVKFLQLFGPDRTYSTVIEVKPAIPGLWWRRSHSGQMEIKQRTCLKEAIRIYELP